MRDTDQSLALVGQDLRQFGLLPFTDPTSPSLVSIVVGAPVRGSWWGHPAGGVIYDVAERLESDPDVLILPLWRGKQTLVHRHLFPALERVVSERARWQMTGLSGVSRRLLARIDRDGFAPAEVRARAPTSKSHGPSPSLRELGQRLLVLTRSVHTPSGAHALEAEPWSSWRSRLKVPKYPRSVESARADLERAAQRLTPGIDPRRFLPWGNRSH